ncbi:MAG: DinB family protein [Bryobacteraceae bacterium]
MPLNQALLPEYDHEMATARETLARVPDGKFDWKPHAKSMSMGHLASHLATLPQWGAMTVETDELDMAPGGKQMEPPPDAKTNAELLAMFDKNVAAGRAAIASADDAAMMKPWALKNNGATLMTMPKVAVLRTWVMNHLVHHRAQLGVYLRLNDIPVPSVYGPSADEGQM